MIIYPAIDIKGGCCVRLLQGLADRETEYFRDPVEPARDFAKQGAEWVHVVDLDGAFTGHSENLAIVRNIAALGLKVQFGGGIRTAEDVKRAFDAGVSRVVIGTRACQDRDFVALLAREYGERIAVGIDAREGKVAVRGWVDTTDMPAKTLAQQVAAVGIRTLIYTDISTDGMMVGPNFEGQKEMWRSVDAKVIASGGVADRHDVIHYRDLSQRFANLDGVIVGKALYEHKVELADLLQLCGGKLDPQQPS